MATHDFLHLSFEYDEKFGFYQWEKKRKQKLWVSVDIPIFAKKASKSDHLKDTVDYDLVDRGIQEVLARKHFHLIESIANDVANHLLKKLKIRSITVSVDKPLAIAHAKKISVSVTRKN